MASTAARCGGVNYNAASAVHAYPSTFTIVEEPPMNRPLFLLRPCNLLRLALVTATLAGSFAAPGARAEDAKPPEEGWIQLFNGKDLDGWTPKIRGYDLGDNFGETFRVEDGVLKVSYDQYERFDNKFGHIFYKDKFANYRLRVEYRFVGEQCPGGPGWAMRNNGLMLHSQSAESMTKEQDFPVSIEVQLLGGSGRGERSTANLCTPGTHVVMDGRLITQHCTNSKSKTFHGDQWVTVEVEVRGNKSFRHFVNGEEVMYYEQPQLDDGDANARRLIKDGDKMLHEGYIALQAESHPTEFRKIELLPLE
jgi:hypothetical protein